MIDGDIVRAIKRRKPRPAKRRAARGAWVEPAWAVRRLVEKENWTVAEAVREVVDSCKLEPRDNALAGVRVAYYHLRKKPWPKA